MADVKRPPSVQERVDLTQRAGARCFQHGLPAERRERGRWMCATCINGVKRISTPKGEPQ